MNSDDANRFLRQAEVCREEATKAPNPIEAASWLQLADDFERRAKQRSKLIERRRPPSLWVKSPPAADAD